MSDIHLSCRNLWKIFGVADGRRITQPEALALEQSPASGHVFGVRDVSLDIRRGETFVIMGLSGSGKSTLVRCLSRLNEPSAGELVLDGKDLIAATDAELIDIRRHKLGMVFQNFALLPHLTVLANVAFPLKIQGVGQQQPLHGAAHQPVDHCARHQPGLEHAAVLQRRSRGERERRGDESDRMGSAPPDAGRAARAAGRRGGLPDRKSVV